jgi:hypothetical protein
MAKPSNVVDIKVKARRESDSLRREWAECQAEVRDAMRRSFTLYTRLCALGVDHGELFEERSQWRQS